MYDINNVSELCIGGYRANKLFAWHTMPKQSKKASPQYKTYRSAYAYTRPFKPAHTASTPTRPYMRPQITRMPYFNPLEDVVAHGLADVGDGLCGGRAQVAQGRWPWRPIRLVPVPECVCVEA